MHMHLWFLGVHKSLRLYVKYLEFFLHNLDLNWDQERRVSYVNVALTHTPLGSYLRIKLVSRIYGTLDSVSLGSRPQ